MVCCGCCGLCDCCKNCFCDPFKLAYVSAIVSMVEAVAVGVLNIVLICMYTCAYRPPDKVAMGFDRFWAWYFYDDAACVERYDDYYAPGWVNHTYPVHPRPQHTTPEANYAYQVTYLVLHSLWFLSALVMMYGNARKLWGFYLPWLVITLTLLVMDITVGAFIIDDMTNANPYHTAMFWALAMYWRLFFLYFVNLSKFGSAFNAFWKSRHKRMKQARRH